MNVGVDRHAGQNGMCAGLRAGVIAREQHASFVIILAADFVAERHGGDGFELAGNGAVANVIIGIDLDLNFLADGDAADLLRQMRASTISCSSTGHDFHQRLPGGNHRPDGIDL